MSAGSAFPMTLAPQCCDATDYVALGERCSRELLSCWHGMRPMGAELYFSLPFRLGLGAEWTIALNALVMAASGVLGLLALRSLLPNPTRLAVILLAAGLLVAHLSFAGALIRNTLSDLPAGGSALVAIWTLTLAASWRKRPLYAAAGLALGLCAMIRAFYLYPALACASVALALLAWRRNTRVEALLFASGFLFPILLQMTATHHFTGAWAFIDPTATAYGEDLHFRTVTYGYDTVLPMRGVRYDAPECFRTAEGMLDAVAKHAWSEVSCLVAYREWFYFGSYTPWGRVYLTDTSERHQSVALLLSNVVVVTVASVWILLRARRMPVLLSIFVFLGAIWGEATAIIPETRFLIVFYVAAWAFAVSAVIAAVLEHWRGRLRRGPGG